MKEREKERRKERMRVDKEFDGKTYKKKDA